MSTGGIEAIVRSRLARWFASPLAVQAVTDDVMGALEDAKALKQRSTPEAQARHRDYMREYYRRRRKNADKG